MVKTKKNEKYGNILMVYGNFIMREILMLAFLKSNRENKEVQLTVDSKFIWAD